MPKKIPIRGVLRAEKKEKEKHKPTGGGFAAQAKRTVVNKGYVGVPRALKARIRSKKK